MFLKSIEIDKYTEEDKVKKQKKTLPLSNSKKKDRTCKESVRME
jgi:hypothetical protein